jgi:hypothetical protein
MVGGEQKGGVVMIRHKFSGTTDLLSQSDAQEIARVAYDLWERRGRTHGGDQLDWYEAERIVRGRKAQQPSRVGRSRAGIRL